MSSFTRRIQRTTKTVKGVVKQRRNHFMGRGSKLGVKNPRDPCVTGKRKKPKAWRAKISAPALMTPPRVKDSPRPTLSEIMAAHRAKMRKKAELRSKGTSLNSTVAYLAKTNRHTGKPHEKKREIARRARQMKEG